MQSTCRSPAVLSTLLSPPPTFQWLTDLSVAFDEVFRVLKPGGIFSFSLFGERTLHELRQCYRDALIAVGSSEDERTHTFFHS